MLERRDKQSCHPKMSRKKLFLTSKENQSHFISLNYFYKKSNFDKPKISRDSIPLHYVKSFDM